MKFGVFSENSERQIYSLLMYFRSQKQSLNDVAILSEDGHRITDLYRQCLGSPVNQHRRMRS